MEIESSNEKEEKIKSIIINYFKWEKEKELLLAKNSNTIISNEPNEFYLVDKIWLNKFKEIVNIDKIIKKLKANSNNSE